MILTFTKPQFKDLIKQGIKIHTIREDKNNRWKASNPIQFWFGNPRNIHTKNSHQFGTGLCSRVETIRIDFAVEEEWQHDTVYIGDNIVLKKPEELKALAINDGFETWSQMRLWFENPECQFSGKIIFWNKCIWL